MATRKKIKKPDTCYTCRNCLSMVLDQKEVEEFIKFHLCKVCFDKLNRKGEQNGK